MAMNYSDKVMDHFTNPRNVGEIENASGCGTVGNAVCGDIMRIYLDIDDAGVINDAKFKTFGCGSAIATSSIATEMIKGKTIEEALQLSNKAVVKHSTACPPTKSTAPSWPSSPSRRPSPTITGGRASTPPPLCWTAAAPPRWFCP